MTTTAPALPQLIDAHAFYSRYSQVIGKPTNSKDGKEWHGSCCRCGGNDRFAFWESGRFSCSIRSSGCGISGSSPYWFLRDVQGLSHMQACDELGVDPGDFESSQKHTLPLLFQAKDEPPNKKWMDAASLFVHRAQKYLWNSGGEKALNYLQSRGLSADTIREARLGFCPGWYSESLQNWGLTKETDEEQEIKIPEGIVIPWFVDGKVWKISVRRPDGQYFQVLGSSDALYNVDELKPNEPVMLVESELDALSVHQEASRIIATVATGGASKGQTAKWIALLKQASHVLLSFDTDDAGNKGAAEWQKKLPGSMRWRPWRHDVNDMLKQQAILVKMWVELGLKAVQTEIEEPVPVLPEVEPIPIPFRESPALLPLPETPKPPIKRKQRDMWQKRNEVGLLMFCTIPRCKQKAIAWRSNISMEEAYCEQHKPERFGW